jgi:Flp pilus assembly protein TadG
MILARPQSKSLSRRGQSGSVAIEFGFSLLFLFPLVVGTAELGLAVFQNMQVNAAVEAGALYALANGWDEPGIIAAVENSFGTTLTNQVSAVTASPVPVQFCGCPTGTTVTNMGPLPCTSTLCGNGNPQRQYIEISASLTRMSVVPNSGMLAVLPAAFVARSVVRSN